MSSDDSDTDSSHREEIIEGLEKDQGRKAMLINLFKTGVGKDNAKRIAQMIHKKDQRMSKPQLERMKTLWSCMQEFRIMFHDRSAEIMEQLHYKEALIEILHMQGDQTAPWKLVLTEQINPFSGKLIIDAWASYQIQLNEVKYFHQRADKLSSALREKFEDANPPRLSEDDDSDDEPEGDLPPPGGSPNHLDDNLAKDPDFSDESDTEMLENLKKPACNILAPQNENPSDPIPQQYSAAQLKDLNHGQGDRYRGMPELTPIVPLRDEKPQNPNQNKPKPKPKPKPKQPKPTKDFILIAQPANHGSNAKQFFSRTRKDKQPHHDDKNQRLQRDQKGCEKHLERSLMQTRAAETAAARSWGRQKSNNQSLGRHTTAPPSQPQPKRQNAATPPFPKRSRINRVEQMRIMSRQFQECLTFMTNELGAIVDEQVEVLSSTHVPSSGEVDLPEDLPDAIDFSPLKLE